MSKSLLKPKIQKIIEFKKWTLKPFQERVIEYIVNKTGDVIISAPTASGKTEAALFPAISETYPDIQKQLKILYISPLIALINDQYERLCALNESDSLKINITKWHSEISQNKKKYFLNNKPHGILIITPESLESFLVNQRSLSIFENIEYYIIDEFHDFLGEIRGDQLRSILNRLDDISIKKPRKLLLSATLNGDESCKKWINQPNVGYIQNHTRKSELSSSVCYFENIYSEKYYEKLNEVTSENKSLIFGNSKTNLELACHGFKKYINNSEKIEIHHGSLDKKIRKGVEEKLKENDNISVFCTNTLELGIDISNIDQVSLIEPPFSVSSFVQRIGRSGRKKDSKINFNLFPTMVSNGESSVFPKLNVNLIRSLALIELQKEHWIEPKEFQTYTYSIFVHQILAIVAQNSPSNISVDKLYMHLRDFHEKVSEGDYKQILYFLIKQRYMNQNIEGYISLGLEGNRLTKMHDFYSVFSTEKEWDLSNIKTKEHLGTISRKLKIEKNDILLFSGKTWQVLEIYKDLDVLKLLPIDISSKEELIKLPLFISSGGAIHRKVHEKMLSIYRNNNFYGSLNKEGNKALQDAREEYKKLLQFDKTFIPIFMGSQVTKLILFILKERAIQANFVSSFIGINSNEINRLDLADLLQQEFSSRKSVEKLVQKLQRPFLCLEKYDYLLPDSILQKSYINHQFCFNDYLEYLNTFDVKRQSA